MPSFGAIKRQDLIRYLRDLGFEARMWAGSISIWLRMRLGWLFPILIAVTSIETSLPGFCGKRGLRGANGRLSKLAGLALKRGKPGS